MTVDRSGGGTRSEFSLCVGTLLFKPLCLTIPCVVTSLPKGHQSTVPFWTDAVYGDSKSVARILKSSALTAHPMLRSDQTVRPRLPAAVPSTAAWEVSGSSHGRSIRLMDLRWVCRHRAIQERYSGGNTIPDCFPIPPFKVTDVSKRDHALVYISCSHYPLT
jgi:hypothetical protein